MMFQDAVAFNNGVLCHLCAVAQRWDLVFAVSGNNMCTAIHFRAVAHPNIILFVTFQTRVVINLRAVFYKRIIKPGVAVNLRLMNHPTVAQSRAIVDLQFAILFGG